MEPKRILDWWFSSGRQNLVIWWNYYVWHTVCFVVGVLVGIIITALIAKQLIS